MFSHFVKVLAEGALAVASLFAVGALCFEAGREVERIETIIESKPEAPCREETAKDSVSSSSLVAGESAPVKVRRKLFGLGGIRMVKDILRRPEDHEINASMEGDEAIIRVKRKTRSLQPT